MLLLFFDRVFATATAGSRMGIWQKEDSRPLDFCQWQFELEVAPASSCEGGLNVYCPVTVWRQRRRHRSAVVLFFFEDKFGRAALLQCVPVSRWEQKPSRIRLLSLVPLDFVGGHANSEPRLHFISFKRKIRKKYQAPSRLYDLNELAAPFLQINPTPHTQSTSYLQFSSNNETSKKGKKREVIASWALYLFVFSFFFFFYPFNVSEWPAGNCCWISFHLRQDDEYFLALKVAPMTYIVLLSP